MNYKYYKWTSNSHKDTYIIRVTMGAKSYEYKIINRPDGTTFLSDDKWGVYLPYYNKKYSYDTAYEVLENSHNISKITDEYEIFEALL